MRLVIAIYPNCTFLDFIGPYTALSSAFDQIDCAALTLDSVMDDLSLLAITPTTTLSKIDGDVDVLLVTGASDPRAALTSAYLAEIRRIGEQAHYVTSVCTGALVLGAAGLLRGYRATSHWTTADLLTSVGAIPTNARVVTDRNRITGGGVTAGIDFGLTLLSTLTNPAAAQAAQLMMEYDPAPPMNAGNPHVAPADVVSRCTEGYRHLHAELATALNTVTLAW